MRAIDVNVEPLPGYRLIERIGAGGYGEVWRAEAPGGLTKAIKFVFGEQHEKRAINELRALDHVRSVRHPFLLSLERIEIVDGRLLVVTELADQSIKDRFDQCRREKKPGIPREELMSYLRDAADALDFMNATHSLQHLDIKPENLLILSGHVKVADFGLVKDVRQSQASLVGGMTPLYAAPEVFRGAPSRQSDQYSLAIVYQEMLTGTLPFAGESAAELTLHHLNDEPDIGMLSRSDRYAVSRALAKDPQHRYVTCREFVDALFNDGQHGSYSQSDSPASYSTGRQQAAEQPVRESRPTEFFDDEQPANWQNGAAHMLVEAPSSSCELIDLPPTDLSKVDSRLTPTVILGIGGTAGRVLAHFRKLTAERYGHAQAPAIQLLQLDTDPKSLKEAIRSDARDLSADELLNLPLRRPQHYRENSQQLLHWLSRRWLYNIPRSLKTEGLRPLGRLALADHARQAGQRIRRAMVQALDPAAIDESGGVLGQYFRRDALRIIIVASISGGTGSGMSLDLGYAVRAILNKLNLPRAEIIGLMMHSTGRDARQSELARVNAYSWLTELHHFSQAVNAYPGDLSCGFPPHGMGVPAFDHTYLLNLGTNLEGTEFDQATRNVAEYIGLNALSPASAFFDSARGSEQHVDSQEQTASGNIRSFGVFRHAAFSHELCDQLAQLVNERLLAKWRISGRDDDQGDPTQEELQLVRRLKLDAAGLAANSRTMIDLAASGSASDFVSTWLAARAKKRGVTPETLIGEIDSLFALQEPNTSETVFQGQRPADLVAVLADKLKVEFRRWINRHIEKPGRRLANASAAASKFQVHIRRVEMELRKIRSANVDRLLQIRREAAAAALANPARGGCLDLTWVDEYFHTCFDHLTIQGAEHLLRVVEAESKAINDEITSLGHELDQVAAVLYRAANSADGVVGGVAAEQQSRRVADRFASRLDDFAQQVDTQLQSEFLDAAGGLVKAVAQGGRLRAQLTAKLQEISRRVVGQLLSSATVQDSGRVGQGSDAKFSGAISTATPTVLEYGGRRRILALLPIESPQPRSTEPTMQLSGKTVTTIQGTDNTLVVCVEADRLSLPHIALDIVERRRDRIEFAGRVHCRTDIEWQPILDTECTANAWEHLSSSESDTPLNLCKTMVV